MRDDGQLILMKIRYLSTGYIVICRLCLQKLPENHGTKTVMWRRQG
jgi:hypothetical protein